MTCKMERVNLVWIFSADSLFTDDLGIMNESIFPRFLNIDMTYIR